jgi:hypothetical protein
MPVTTRTYRLESMADVSWVQVVVGAVTIFGTALKLPAAKLDWGEEHRLVARIKRQKEVLDAVEHPSVKRLLESDNEWQALNLVALQMFPYKLRLRLAVYFVWVGYLGSVAVVICSLVFHWGPLYFGLGILVLLFAYFVSYPIFHRLLLYQANRRAYVFCGAPKDFRIADRAKVPRQGDLRKRRRNIYIEFDARMKASDSKGKGLSLEEFAPEANAIWAQILDEQKAMWFARGQRLRERLYELNARDPRPELWEKLESRVLRVQKRLKPSTDTSQPEP